MSYRIRVGIEISECKEAQSETILKPKMGVYEQVISPEMGESIDGCEGALLDMSYEAMRRSLSAHLSQTSQKVAQQLRTDEQEVEMKPYRVDGEVGRIEFEAAYVNTPMGLQGMLPILKGKERYKSRGFKEIGLVHGTIETSYTKSSRRINRIRHQEGATPARTLRDNSEVEGQAIQQRLSEQTQAVLSDHHFSPQGSPSEIADWYRQRHLQTLPATTVKVALTQVAPDKEWQAKMIKNKVPYEKPTQSVSICVDDVNTKRQKEQRSKPDQRSDDPPLRDTNMCIIRWLILAKVKTPISSMAMAWSGY